MSRHAAKASHHILTVSQSSKTDIIKVSSVAPSKISVIYNFIDASFEAANNDEKYFVCVSTIEPGKNLEMTLSGYAKFKEDVRYANYKFYWIGRIGWVYTEDYITALIKQFNVEKSFIITGYVTDLEKASLIRNATAMVYLSHYEGFGLPLLEGMMFNKPAIASNNSSLPEVAGNTALLCDSTNPLSIAEAFKMMIIRKEELKSHIPEQLKKFAPKAQIKIFALTLEKALAGNVS